MGGKRRETNLLRSSLGGESEVDVASFSIDKYCFSFFPNSFSWWGSKFLQRKRLCSNMISKFVCFVSLLLRPVPVTIFRFVPLCLPSTQCSSVMISRFVSLCPPSTASSSLGLSPFVSLRLDPVPSWFPGLSPFDFLLRMQFCMMSRFVPLCLSSTGSIMISRFVSLPSVLDPVPSWFPGLSPFVSLPVDAVPSWFPRRDFWVCLPFSPFYSLLLDPVVSWSFVSLLLDPVPSSFPGFPPFVSFCLPSTGSSSVMVSRSPF